MLRFHLTTDDLTRLRVATRPQPLWEIAFSLHLLQNQNASLLFDPWRQSVRRALASAGLTRAVTALARLYPWDDYSPDFLVPGRDLGDLDTGLDLVMSTPRTTLRREITLMARQGQRLPDWSENLVEGDLSTLKRLGDLLRRYHEIAVAPFSAHVNEAFAKDRAHRAASFLDSGVQGLLASYAAQSLDWSDGILSAPCPMDADFHGEGRSMTLLPSFFCVRPVSSADAGEPPTLAYPVFRPLGWMPRAVPTEGGEERPAALAQLIGATRAAVLNVLDEQMTTSQLAAVIGMSLPTASRHTAVLREAGLVESHRHGPAVLHMRTPLGHALLDGDAAPPRWGCSATT